MPMIAFSIPIAAGKSGVFLAAQGRFAIDRRAEFEASRRRLGIVAERGFLQHTPSGDLAIVVFDVADPARMFAGTASSTESIDVDFREYLLDVFGLDVTRAPAAAPSELVFEWRMDESATGGRR